ncbi:hypothetical protein KFU94_23490 [Chloroflexi bacterium TSY]|nr:hypothetical protein [Chloroflexi bacterium TSY]
MTTIMALRQADSTMVIHLVTLAQMPHPQLIADTLHRTIVGDLHAVWGVGWTNGDHKKVIIIEIVQWVRLFQKKITHKMERITLGWLWLFLLNWVFYFLEKS